MKQKEELILFLNQALPVHLMSIADDASPLWGTMNVWQMTEHLAWPFKASNGSFKMPQTTEDDKLERVKNIGLLNDRPMQRLFNNPILTDEFKQLRNANRAAAIEELMTEVSKFQHHFESSPEGHTEMHNIFGPLTYDEWLWFHYKHCKHHLEQFGVVRSSL